jgi:hypothetical protein
MTLVEVVIAGVILGLGILAMLTAFSGIRESIQVTRWKTLATSLAQDRLQQLRQRPYYRIPVTETKLTLPDVNPVVDYDPANFPVEVVQAGGIPFSRYVYVDRVTETSGQIASVPSTDPDTGMKQVTISLVWTYGNKGKRSFQLRNIIANPDRTMSRSVFSGVLRDTTTAPISGGMVGVVEYPQWVSGTDVDGIPGYWKFNMSEGTYTVRASAPGFFSESRGFFINSNANKTLTPDFELNRMSSGTLKGAVWINDHLVISQIAARIPNSNEEYVELFNPTDQPIDMTQFELWIQQTGPNFAQIPLIPIPLGNTIIPPKHYYLIMSKNGSIQINLNAGNITLTADAYYTNLPSYLGFILADGSSGAVQIRRTTGGAVVDAVSWAGAAGGEGISLTSGFNPNDQYVRRCSTDTPTAGWGRSYDTGNNIVDFQMWRLGNPGNVRPETTTSVLATLVTGVPAVGAVVHATDGLSVSTTAVLSATSPPYASFTLPSVATGTWSVIVASGTNALRVDGVAVSPIAIVPVPGPGTTPPWPGPRPTAVLAGGANLGYIAGVATDAFNAPINNLTAGIRLLIPSTSDHVQASPTGNGAFLLPIAAGTYELVANPVGEPTYAGAYVTRSQSVTVTAGNVAAVSFQLSQAGRLNGFMSSGGAAPLSGIPVVAKTVTGDVMADTVSEASGAFYLTNLSSGTYYISPLVSGRETYVATPAVGVSSNTLGQLQVTMTAGGDLAIGTFTVTGSVGYINGSVRRAGRPLMEGATVVASTYTLTAPPVISSNTASGYYSAATREDGTYRLEVIGNTTPYIVTVFSTKISNGVVSLQTPQYSGSVTVGQGDDVTIAPISVP